MDSLRLILSFIIISGGFVYFIICLYSLWGHFKTVRKCGEYYPTVSVIIPARNEEHTIGSLLTDLLGQEYPSHLLEIVVVDDGSSDGTRDIVQQYGNRDTRIRYADIRTSLSPYTHKKKAVHTGILASNGEIIMTVDADCHVPSTWVKEMVRYFVDGVNLVAGEVRIEGKRFWDWFEILEFTGIQMMASGLMNAGFPITCNGGNLAYRRTSFESVNGFDGIGRMVSGDDDLLMQKITGKQPSSVVFASGEKSAVLVRANESIRDFFTQRTRWASKVSHYPSLLAVVILSIFFTFFTALMVGFAGAVMRIYPAGMFLGGLMFKLSGDIALVGYGVYRLGDMKPLILFPIAEIIHIPYILSVTLKGYFGSFEWKGRQTSAMRTIYD